MGLSNSDVMPLIAGADYTIDRSLRFNDADSAYLSRTPSTTGNRKTWTLSAWVKRGNLATSSFQHILSADGGSNPDRIYFGRTTTAPDQLIFGLEDTYALKTTMLFRDVSAWYHIVCAVDTTQSTSSDRMKLYVNGEQITDFDTETYPTQDYESQTNLYNRSNFVGSRTGGSDPFDGYLAEVNFIDGQALDASYFGETDSTYGHWKPIEYTGSYGTNGFYLDFGTSNTSDQSGNGNNFTANNLATTDAVLDSPTNNFATLNYGTPGSSIELSEGNLESLNTYGGANGAANTPNSTMLFPVNGKWYFEVTITYTSKNDNINSRDAFFGIGCPQYSVTSGQSPVAAIYYYQIYLDGTYIQSSLPQVDVGDIFGIAVDTTNETVDFYQNDSAYGTTVDYSGISEVKKRNLTAWLGNGTSTGYMDYVINFGQDSSFAGNETAQGNTDDNGYGDFYYTPPTGYLALCTANLDDPAVIPSENFNTVLYTGNASSQSIGGVGFQPGLSWQKSRSAAQNWRCIDEVRGSSQVLKPDGTQAEVDGSVTFDSDGFNFTANDGEDANDSGKTYVAWNWYGSASSGSSNTNGSITTTVSANQDAGFSIVSYTGGGSTGDTIGHGLSQAPEMMIWRTRDSVENWGVFNSYVQTLNTPDRLYLNTTDAEVTSGDNRINALSSTTITLGSNNGEINSSSDDYIMYCFHSVEGFSKVGYYTGNADTNGNGPFIYLGFKPKFWMHKRTDAAGDGWWVYDGERDTYNPLSKLLIVDRDNSEYSQSGSATPMDFVSNGVKIRNSSTDGSINGSGNTYIYIAFAEQPFKYTNAR